jgi:energy-coupling factor transport system substrate-specific component
MLPTSKLRILSLASVFLALNLTLAKTAALLALPVYLDSVGTLLAGALLPPAFVVGVAILTSLLGGLVVHPAFPLYAGTQLAIALLALVVARRGLLNRWWTSALAGIGIGMVAALVSAPVTVLAFGGVTLGGATAINVVLMAAGKNIWNAVITGSFFVEMLDKPAAALLAYLALRRLPERLKSRGSS